METSKLIARIAQQDGRAFEQLYRQMRSKLVLQAKALMNDDLAAAEDTVDEAFLDIWAKAKSYSGTGNAEGWVRRIVRNKAIDQIRRNGKSFTHGPLDMAMETPSVDPSPEDNAISTDTSGFLGRALQSLPGSQREVLHLFYFRELSVDHIAEQIEVPAGTVKSRLFHARESLRKSVSLAYN